MSHPGSRRSVSGLPAKVVDTVMKLAVEVSGRTRGGGGVSAVSGRTHPPPPPAGQASLLLSAPEGAGHLLGDPPLCLEIAIG